MAIDYPDDLDDFTNPAAGDSMATVSHAGQHSNANDAIEALEAKLGTGASPASGATDGQVLTADGAGGTAWESATSEVLLPAPSGGDDTATIQALIDGGGRFAFRAGVTYLINATTGLDVKSNTELIIPADTTLDQLAAVTSSAENRILLINGRTNVRITGGILRGKRATDSGGQASGVRCTNSTDVVLAYVTAKDFSLDGFYVAEGAGVESERVRVVHCHADNNKRQGLSATGVKGLDVDGGTYRNTNGSAPEAGIDIEPNAGFVCQDVRIRGASFKGNTGCGILAITSGVTGLVIQGNTIRSNTAQGIRVSRCAKVTVTGNTVESNTSTGILVNADAVSTSMYDTTISNNVVAANGAGGVRLVGSSEQECRRITVTGNTIRANTGVGVELNHAGHCTVTGNTISANTTDGVQVQGSNSVHNVVSGNTVVGQTLNGINVTTGSVGTHVTGNHVVENGNHGIRLNSCNENAVVGNRCFGNGTATNATFDNIHLAAADDNLVGGNLCKQGTGANKSRYGINVSTATCDTNVVTNNDLKNGGATGTLNNAGTGTVTTSANRT